MIDVFNGYGAEIELSTREDFLKIMETLTRVGTPKDDQLIQVCHILHKRGRYAIVHYNELKALDGTIPRQLVMDEDIEVRNAVALLLDEWNLAKLVDVAKAEEYSAPLSSIKIIHYKDKSEWKLTPMYTFRKKEPMVYRPSF